MVNEVYGSLTWDWEDFYISYFLNFIISSFSIIRLIGITTQVK